MFLDTDVSQHIGIYEKGWAVHSNRSFFIFFALLCDQRALREQSEIRELASVESLNILDSFAYL
jgi:hypothetical protein